MLFTKRECELIRELCWERIEVLNDRVKDIQAGSTSEELQSDLVISRINKGIEELDNLCWTLAGYLKEL
jgi:hypothetical protein